MRTTITLDDDIVAAVEQIRRETGAGVSAAVNELARSGLARRRDVRPADVTFPTFDLGLTVDISNYGQVLELMEDHE